MQKRNKENSPRFLPYQGCHINCNFRWKRTHPTCRVPSKWCFCARQVVFLMLEGHSCTVRSHRTKMRRGREQIVPWEQGGTQATPTLHLTKDRKVWFTCPYSLTYCMNCVNQQHTLEAVKVHHILKLVPQCPNLVQCGTFRTISVYSIINLCNKDVSQVSLTKQYV